MYHTIYKTTNNINGKSYIGKHQTNDLDDDYLGSGKLLIRAIDKYGTENFMKEILHIFNTKKEMDIAEKILVVPDIETNYNLTNGGHGSWSHLNYSQRAQIGLKNGNYNKVWITNGIEEKMVPKEKEIPNDWYKGTSSIKRKNHAKNMRHNWNLNKKFPLRSNESREKTSRALIGHKVSEETKKKLRQINLGRKHSEETKQKIRLSLLGRKKCLQ